MDRRIGHFSERPYQAPKSGYFGATGLPIKDLTLSNEIYDPEVGTYLYNRYLDEKTYANECGFDGSMLNEHHSTPFCTGGAANVEAEILAHITKNTKIRYVLETLRPGIIFFWDGDGVMTHEEQMRSLRLMKEEVIPAVRGMAAELDLPAPQRSTPPRARR